LPLSAGSPQQLLLSAQRLIEHFTSIPSSEHALADVMFTLCTGRRIFESRAVFLASSLQEFVYLLRRFVRGESDSHIVCQTNCPAPELGRRAQHYSELDHAGFLALAARWLRGADIEWAELFKGLDFYRVSLPTYRFSSELHAIPWATGQAVVTPVSRSASTVFRPAINTAINPAINPAINTAPNADADDVLRICREVFGRVLKCAPETLDLNCGLDRLGFDSVMVSVVTEGLEHYFGPMSQTLMFECRTLQDVIDRVSNKMVCATTLQLLGWQDASHSPSTPKPYGRTWLPASIV
jgi:hypothetical protein